MRKPHGSYVRVDVDPSPKEAYSALCEPGDFRQLLSRRLSNRSYNRDCERLKVRLLIMTGESFQCEHCGGTFIKTRSDGGAELEYEQRHQRKFVREEAAMICHDCFRAFMRWAERNQVDLTQEEK